MKDIQQQISSANHLNMLCVHGIRCLYHYTIAQLVNDRYSHWVVMG